MTLFSVDRPVTDRASRDRIVNDLHRNLFVEAGAGTGKTRVLVDRVVRLVATGTVSDVSRLVAITFTEAAAAELRDRIRSALELAAIDEEAPEAERERCQAARDRMDTATITTLHGFAQRILAEHPLEAGLPPAFEVDDEVQARVRFVERWARFLDDLYADGDAATDLLVADALGLRVDGLQGVARLLHARWDALVDVELPVPELPTIDLQPILESVEDMCAIVGDRLEGDDKLAGHVVRWCGLRAQVHELLADDDELEVLRTLSVWSVPKPGRSGKANYWNGDKDRVVAALIRTGEQLTGMLRELRTVVLQRLLPHLQRFTLDGAVERRRDGRLEFHDLLVHARDLVRGNDSVRASLARRMDVILIDEFQDTDPLQLDIAFALAAADPTAPVPPWPEAQLAEGKVLVVGDPKQSIYAFRGADISLWDRTKAMFGDGVERLEQNFRTVPQLLSWVNATFERVIAEGKEGAQPPYEALAAFRPEVRDEPAVVIVGQPWDARAAQIREREAADLARLVLAMKVDGWQVVDEGQPGECRPARFDDVAILVPTRTPLRQLERALDAVDVPYRIESRSLVWATDAVRELLNVLTAIDDPGDDVALVAALRSPGFACSDVDLMAWRQAGGRWVRPAPPPEDVSPDHPVARGIAALDRYHELRWSLPVDRLVEQVVRELRLVELTFAQRRPRDHWRRLRFVVDQARAFVEAGGASLGDFLEWAAVQTDEGATVIETPAPEPDDDAVRIMTIHGSKGLEFPIVVLAGLASTTSAVGPWVRYGEEGPEVALGNKDHRFATPGYEALADAAAELGKYEAHRLLYVAATRARDHLVVSLHHSTRGRKDSAAAQLWPVQTDDNVAAWWRTADIPDQLAFPGPAADDGGPAMTAVERKAWIARHSAIVESSAISRVVTPSSLGHDEPEVRVVEPQDDTEPVQPVDARRRGGTAFGRAVHAVLQTLDLDTEDVDSEVLRQLCESAATAEGIPADERAVAQRVRAALGAPVLDAARRVPPSRRWRELPLTVPIPGTDRLVEGYLDLLYDDGAGGFVLVDYKTDDVDDPSRLAAAVEGYRLQLGAYALALEAALGRSVSRAVLLFVGPDGAREVDIDDLAAAMDDVRRELRPQPAAP